MFLCGSMWSLKKHISLNSSRTYTINIKKQPLGPILKFFVGLSEKSKNWRLPPTYGNVKKYSNQTYKKSPLTIMTIMIIADLPNQSGGTEECGQDCFDELGLQ